MRRTVLNRFISPLTEHLSVSLLWVIGCLPLVTAPAATAALFEVTGARCRREDGEPPATGRGFVVAFRQYLRPSLVVGLGWAALGAVLAADLLIAARMGSPISEVLQVALLALLLLYAAGSVALFPVLVSYRARPHHQMRTAILVALLFPGRTLLALAAVAAAGTAVWIMPITIIIVPSLAATAVWRLYRGAFRRLARGRSDPAGRERRQRTRPGLRARAGEPTPDRAGMTPRTVIPAGSQ